jgi:hypothetical protein
MQRAAKNVKWAVGFIASSMLQRSRRCLLAKAIIAVEWREPSAAFDVVKASSNLSQDWLKFPEAVVASRSGYNEHAQVDQI